MRLSGIQSTRLSHHVPRRFRPLPAQDADIVPSSLRKTLEAHRSSNRARLIRKVYPRTPATGLLRPWIPLENRAGYRPPEPLGTPLEESERSSKKPSGKRRTRKRIPETNASSPQNTHIIPIRYAEDITEQNPWIDFLASDYAIGDASTHLDAEIQAFDRYLTPTPHEQAPISQLNDKIASLLRSVAPHPPKLIGSHYTGLAQAHSDLHFLLPFEDIPRSRHQPRGPSATRPQIRDAHTTLLCRVESTLQSHDMFSGQVKWAGKGKSVLEARHQPTGLLLRFHCGETVPALSEYIRVQLPKYPALRPLYNSTRSLLESRGLFGLTQGNLGPEPLAILILAFLKMKQPGLSGSHRLGDHFLAFLKFYGSDINLQSSGIAVEPSGVFGADILRHSSPGEDTEPAHRRGQRSLIGAKRTASAKGNSPADRRLCIQDPTQYMNDLGRSCTRTPELQQVLSTAYERLSYACDTWEGRDMHGSILTAAIQANFDGLVALRKRLVCPVD
ncbi:hypothetical protein N7478_001522 [Penicillium angulare]|uniref:uncharacterized protein n=1 Tax=Penicillium angulare TaxID=116970 RepID=UPI002541838F|nr:uncharacterized protein N7478_001522 [Penicillium angulare]KAJ5288492.1 hypothetical protein N7478_001522 [Penicillium angulare]